MTTATIATTAGDIVVELAEADAPKATSNFVKLAREGFYDGVIFHRVIPGFVIQGGDGEHGRVDDKGEVRRKDRVGQGGPGYRFAKDQGARVHHNEAIGRGIADWRWKLTANASLVDTLLFESGRDNTFVRNVLGVQVAVAEGLAMKAGLETRYNSDVEPGIENTDRLTTVNLVYRFK